MYIYILSTHRISCATKLGARVALPLSQYWQITRKTITQQRFEKAMRTSRKRASSAMKVNLLALLLLVVALTDGQPTACPNQPSTQGYSSIAAINAAMNADLASIASGKAPTPPYVFTLCPGTTFDASQTALLPVLSGAVFRCGDSGALSNNCIISGGTTQVSITDSTTPGYTLQSLQFQGITFEGFTGTSIAALAGNATTASFSDCSWTVSDTDGKS
jgi:hypothetical protein